MLYMDNWFYIIHRISKILTIIDLFTLLWIYPNNCIYKACIREIKKRVTIIDWTDADLTLENCVTTNFDLKISSQLESDWHRLQPETKQLVNDLRQLRTLFHYLLQYDCIAFWRLINNIRIMGTTSRNPSMWLGKFLLFSHLMSFYRNLSMLKKSFLLGL